MRSIKLPETRKQLPKQTPVYKLSFLLIANSVFKGLCIIFLCKQFLQKLPAKTLNRRYKIDKQKLPKNSNKNKLMYKLS